TPLAERFGIPYPIFAFSVHPPVVAEVSKAGGFGVLGALRFSPDELDRELSRIDEQVDGAPYGVNVVMPASFEGAGIFDADQLVDQIRASIPEGHRKFVEDVLTEYGVPPLPKGQETTRELLGWTDATSRPLVEVALSHPIKLLANALGPPPEDVVTKAHDRAVPVAALVGNVDQARKQVAAGVDIIVAQGTEAAGHTGEVASMVLWPQVVDAVAPRPVLAAGGIGTGRQVAAALAMGAQGVWTGTLWLLTKEAELIPMVVEKLVAATSRDTVRSRSLTGKPARQLRTAWTEVWDDPNGPGTLPMPLQFFLTAEAVQRIYLSGNRDLVGFAAGQVIGMLSQVQPAGDVVRRLVREYDEAVERLSATRAERVTS
ncbi:MAG TPA: nitronate monooxygenase family protein, partial [Actinomycetota bacterium]